MSHALSRRGFIKLAATAAAATAVTGLVGCGGSGSGSASSEKVVNVFTWDGYVPPDVIQLAKDKLGIKIQYSYFSTNEEMLAKLQATGGSDYDFIIASDYALDLANKAGLLQKIDSSRLSNWGNIDSRLQNTWYDPDNSFSIPYWISSTGILYNPEKTNLTFESVNDLLDPSLKDAIALHDNERDVIGTALVSLGYDYNTTDASEIEKAQPWLANLRPNVKVFDTDGPEFRVTNGECIASVHTGAQSIAGLLENPKMKAAHPKECTTIAIDGIVIPKNAPHLDAVYEFLDFELDPETVAVAVAYTHYFNAVKGYVDLVPELVANNEIDIIDDAILDNASFGQDLGDALKLYDSLWTEFKG